MACQKLAGRFRRWATRNESTEIGVFDEFEGPGQAWPNARVVRIDADLWTGRSIERIVIDVGVDPPRVSGFHVYRTWLAFGR